MGEKLYIGRRLCYNGSLCTVRFIGTLSGTKGEWLGIEWDDPSRGKHQGVHHGQQMFHCLRTSSNTCASFVRPNRPHDSERTVLEAIKFKYGADTNGTASNTASDAVIISGKVAEEVGFDKVAGEQAQLAELRIVLLDDLAVNGIAKRDASMNEILEAQRQLIETCPNITELDIGWNTIETWQDIAYICAALPKLRTLKASGLRLREFDRSHSGRDTTPFNSIRELHLDECLINMDQMIRILHDAREFPSLSTLSLSKNEFIIVGFDNDNIPQAEPSFPSVKNIIFENNEFTKLSSLSEITQIFPGVTSISFQGCQINSMGSELCGLADREHVVDGVRQFPGLQTLDVSRNQISSYDFIDVLPQVLPNLTSLKVSHNPLYVHPVATTGGFAPEADAKATERAYYLTLARLPKLEMLNHTKVTTRDREEGEIYYLSVVDKDLFSFLLSTASTGNRSLSTPSKPESQPILASETNPNDSSSNTPSNHSSNPSSDSSPVGSSSKSNPNPSSTTAPPPTTSASVQDSVQQRQDKEQLKPVSSKVDQQKRKSYDKSSNLELSSSSGTGLSSQSHSRWVGEDTSGPTNMVSRGKLIEESQEIKPRSDLGAGPGSKSKMEADVLSRAKIRIKRVAQLAERMFPRYQDLCTRYGRESLITKFLTVESLLVVGFTDGSSVSAAGVSKDHTSSGLPLSSVVVISKGNRLPNTVRVNVDGKVDERSLRSAMLQQAPSSSMVVTSMGGTTNSEPISYPRGSVGARLVQCTFYVQKDSSKKSSIKSPNPTVSSSSTPIPHALNPKAKNKEENSSERNHYLQPNDQPRQASNINVPPTTTSVLTLQIPRTLPTNTLMALLVRHFHPLLQPLQFRLIYESRELDPVGLTAESSTRSQAYGDGHDAKTKEERWAEWGEWDADEVVEAAWKKMVRQEREAVEVGRNNDGYGPRGAESKDQGRDGAMSDSEEEEEGGHETWTDEGYLIREGRKWRRREVEILSGMRSWGDWIEEGVKEVRIRVEPFPRISWCGEDEGS